MLPASGARHRLQATKAPAHLGRNGGVVHGARVNRPVRVRRVPDCRRESVKRAFIPVFHGRLESRVFSRRGIHLPLQQYLTHFLAPSVQNGLLKAPLRVRSSV